MKGKIALFFLGMMASGAVLAANLTCNDVVGTWRGDMGGNMGKTVLIISGFTNSMFPPDVSLSWANDDTLTFAATCQDANGHVAISFSPEQYGSLDVHPISKTQLSVNANLIYGANGSGILTKS